MTQRFVFPTVHEITDARHGAPGARGAAPRTQQRELWLSQRALVAASLLARPYARTSRRGDGAELRGV